MEITEMVILYDTESLTADNVYKHETIFLYQFACQAKNMTSMAKSEN